MQPSIKFKKARNAAKHKLKKGNNRNETKSLYLTMRKKGFDDMFLIVAKKK